MLAPTTHLQPTIDPQHFQEWLDSAVAPDLIRLNLISLHDTTPLEYLLYALPPSERRNDGRLRDKWLNKYAHTEMGGWWCSGIDLLTFNPALWGCFKPNQPRLNHKGQPIKYEHPPQADTEIFALRVPDRIWEQIASRYGSKRYDSPLALQLQGRYQPISFWEWLLKHPEIPLIVTEGVKKAAALLSAGYAAIALPGIFNGYRQPKDKLDNIIALPRLIPQLQVLAAGGREIYLAFDQDQKPKTIANVRIAITKTGQLLARQLCPVKVIQWSYPEKGVDDLIAARGVDALIAAYNAAQSLDTWLAAQTTKLTYPTALTLSQRYLGAFSPPPDARLIALKANKGTGKTEWLAAQVQQALAGGQPVLILTHRVQLGQALANRFGVPYVSEIKDSQWGKTLGYGLCVDSLHPRSQAQFQAQSWENALVVIDECEQVFWHLLNANTEVQKVRVSVLRSLKTLIQTALSGDGKIYLSDADLSDVSIDYVKSLAGFPLNPWIVVNDYRQPDNCWDVFTYSGNSPRNLVAALEQDIQAGGKPFICCSAQKAKSKWGTRNLEAYLTQLFPQRRILRIDSESVANPDHPAYGCIAHLNEVLSQYDIVLASPSIETGVSIDLQGHFTAVWIIAQGGTPENAVRQAAARIRDNIPRHLWAAEQGIGRIGNGSTSLKSLLASQHAATRLNIRLLAASEFDDDYLEVNFQPESLLTWGKMAVRVNFTMRAYRDTLVQELKGEGHRLIDATEMEAHHVEAAVKATQEAKYQQYQAAVAAAADLDEAQYRELADKRGKTEEELIACRKGDLSRRYGVEVTPDLVAKDDEGWYSQLLLHYHLTVGGKFLLSRDLHRAQSQVEQGEGAIFQPDFNRALLLAQVRLLSVLGVEKLLDSQEVFRGTDEFLVGLAELVKRNFWQVKCILNLTVNEQDSPIAIAQALLGLLGLKLRYLGRWGSRGNRTRVYGGVEVVDSREEVFRRWLERDEATWFAA